MSSDPPDNPIPRVNPESLVDQTPLKLTIEERTPWASWIFVSVLTLATVAALAWAINAGNPKITATDLMETLTNINTSANAQTPIPIPTSTPKPGEYTATLEISPTNPTTPDGIITLTSTLTLDNKPVEGAKVHFTFSYWGTFRDADGTVTDSDGVSVTQYNIHKALAQWTVRTVAAFFVDDKLVVRTTDYFTPVP